MSKWMTCAETAKLLRQALKESFPSVKFTVKSKTYSGGASIRVGWVDGPVAADVKEITDRFEGAYFDGMIDYQGSRYHKLDGEEVHFGANFIFVEHELSKARAEAVIELCNSHYGRPDWVSLEGNDSWGYRVMVSPQAPYISDQVAKFQKQVGAIEPQESATLARVQFAGDDGYGAGTVGRKGIEGEGEQCYKAISQRQAVAS